jgi:oligosaccharide repeat unit polymerase
MGLFLGSYHCGKVFARMGIVHLSATALIGGLVALNYRIGKRNVLYPAFGFAAIWLIVLLLYAAQVIELNPLSSYTLLVVILGIVAFSIGSGLGQLATTRPAANAPNPNPIFKRVMFLYCLLALPGCYLYVRSLSVVGGLDGFLESARAAILIALENGERRLPFLYTSAITLSVLVAFIFLIELRDWQKERWWFIGSIAVALTFCILTTGRTLLLELIVGLSGIYLLKTKRFAIKDAWRFARWPAAVLIVLLLVVAIFSKAKQAEDGGIGLVFQNMVLGYAVVPTAGFDYVLGHESEFKYEPNHTFRELHPLLKYSVDAAYIPPVPPNDDFLFVPSGTNVFTMFKHYYVDFGLAGMLVAVFVIGVGQGWLFRKALSGSHLYIFLFAVSLYPLAMCAFDDQYSLFSNYLKQFVLAICYFTLLRKSPLGRRHHGPQRLVTK